MIRNLDIESRQTLEDYMSKIKHIPILSLEKEREYADKYYKTQDKEAGQQLILHNIRFVVHTAYKYKEFRHKVLDLIQEGTLGLMRALSKYNPAQGYRFISYAECWIRYYIQQYCMANYSIVKLGTTRTQRKFFESFGKAKRLMASLSTGELSREEQVKFLSEYFNIPVDQIESLELMRAFGDFYLDKEVYLSGDAQSRTYKDDLPYYGDSAEDIIIEQDMQEKRKTYLSKAIDSLPPRHAAVIRLRHFPATEVPSTFNSIGKQWKVSRQRVCQLEEEALKNLSSQLENTLPL